MGRFIKFLIIALTFNLVDSAKKAPPDENTFIRQHIISRAEARKAKAGGHAGWDALAAQRGVQDKPSNHFIQGEYQRYILPAVQQNSQHLTGLPSTNIWRTNQKFTQYHIDRRVLTNGRPTITRSRVPFKFGMDYVSPTRRVPIHYEGEPRNTVTKPGPTKKPKKFKNKGTLYPGK